MSVVTITALKAKYETGDFPTQQDFIDLIDTLGAGTSYTKYTAQLSQTGTNAPTAVVLENTIGAIVWTRTAAGNYRGTLTGAFPLTKTFTIINQEPGGGFNSIKWSTTSIVNVTTTSADDVLNNTSVEIRVYP